LHSGVVTKEKRDFMVSARSFERVCLEDPGILLYAFLGGMECEWF
jgi:hypothetical protein